MSKRQRAAVRELSDFGTGAIPVVIEEVPLGPNTRATFQRARRQQALEKIDGVTKSMLVAAEKFAIAYEHMCEGKGLGPIDPQSDRAVMIRDGLGVQLLPQERAITSAERHRIGEQAMGLAAYGLVFHVVIAGGGLREWERIARWRNGTARPVLLAALSRLADAYGCA